MDALRLVDLLDFGLCLFPSLLVLLRPLNLALGIGELITIVSWNTERDDAIWKVDLPYNA